MLFLGGITFLSKIVSTLTSSWISNPALTINVLLFAESLVLLYVVAQDPSDKITRFKRYCAEDLLEPRRL
ncbi:hypothetical protein [Microvirga sp. BSC39]|uniref:hypothetical protein n=1 Tax=Microvirga sp. BSC39 TaxID=1549810 RepID=UPI0004E890BF|nr:hypothetical protein [Microvirga sp. BSC39]KFG66550.1 hypothetical protein JH26_28440 [Microvirga sp. BSC39]